MDIEELRIEDDIKHFDYYQEREDRLLEIEDMQ